MNIIRKSLTRKVILLVIIIGLISAVGIYLTWNYLTEYPFEYSLIGLGVITVIFLGIIYKYIGRPLHKIIEQMKLIITGRNYKKIYTNRVDEIGVIANFFNDVTDNIEDISNKVREQKRMSSELEIASEIQNTILPLEAPTTANLQIVAKNRPAVEVGGDSFDFIKSGENLFLYIGDVTGHGVPAGLIMMMVNTLIHTYSETLESPYDIIVKTNTLLKPRIKSSMFMTLLMLKWNEQNKKMTYVGAGHEHFLVHRATTGKLEAFKGGGIALGMVPDNTKLVKELEIPLSEGDTIILYTDGIVEAKNDNDEMFGFERFKETVAKYAAQYGPDGIAHHTSLDFSKFVGDAEQADDITLIVIKYTGKEEKQEIAEKSTKW